MLNSFAIKYIIIDKNRLVTEERVSEENNSRNTSDQQTSFILCFLTLSFFVEYICIHISYMYIYIYIIYNGKFEYSLRI